jgi:hypothetical protein
MISFEIREKVYELPEYITIGKYSQIYKIKDILLDKYFGAKMVNILSGCPVEDLLSTNMNGMSYLIEKCMELIPNTKRPYFYDRFTFKGVEYGYINDWKELTFAEYIDLDSLLSKKDNDYFDNIHFITAIMYRPIIKKGKKNSYEIEKYDITKMKERAELFKKELDIKYFLGGQFFFLLLGKKLQDLSLMSSMSIMKQLKMIWMLRRLWWIILSNKYMDGTSYLTGLQKTILRNIKKF